MGKGGHGGSSSSNLEEHGSEREYYTWLAFCTVGMVSSLTMYGICLEYATSGGRKMHEVSFVFVTTTIYSITAYLCREYFQEKPTEISKYQMLTLSCTSILSTITSVRSLRYVIYPVQVLFKSCKPVPVMIFGTVLGKKYPMKKYMNVAIITTGVALFMGGGSSASKGDMGNTETTTIVGALLLTLSLCFDGATGAYEDKLMAVNNVEPFDLMFNIQLGKSLISFVTIVITNQLPEFVRTLSEGGMSLFVLGLTGALGQVFVFVTISKFGALNCALIGLVRKILSLVLSFLLYGHTMNGFQTTGLLLALSSMVANFVDKGGKRGASEADMRQAETTEREGLLSRGGDEESGEVRSRGDESPKAIRDPFGDVELSPITSQEVEAAVRTPDQPSDGEFEVLVEVDRVTPIKSPGDIQVEVDRVTPVAGNKSNAKKSGRSRKGK